MNPKGFRLKLKDVPEVTTDNKVSLKIPVHPEVTGKPLETPISFFVITFPPKTSSPSHLHASDEYEYVISGRGLLDTGNEKDIILEPDTIVYNPKGTTHKITNIGNEPLKVLKVHIPPIMPFGPADTLTAKAISVARETFKTLYENEKDESHLNLS